MSVFAVVPIKDLQGTKSRLSPVLDPRARAGLTMYLAGRVLAALGEAGVGEFCVVSPDPLVLSMIQEKGATPLLQESRGLNPALEEGRRWAASRDASSLLIFPADLPLIGVEDVLAVVEGMGEGPSVVICPDRTSSGTNALLLRPPDALPFAFGPDSYREHLRLARERDLPVKVCERRGVAFDLDTGEDLAQLGPDLPGEAPRS